jgi:hypothetical protein
LVVPTFISKSGLHSMSMQKATTKALFISIDSPIYEANCIIVQIALKVFLEYKNR